MFIIYINLYIFYIIIKDLTNFNISFNNLFDIFLE